MKKLILCIVMLTISMGASAQRGLAINELFEGRLIPQERMVETRVRGKMLTKYQLTAFRSLRFTASADDCKRIGDLVMREKSVHSVTQTGKAAQTVMLQLPPLGATNRFLCFKQKAAGKHQKDVTVIYMEGPVSSLDQLNELLQN